MREIVRKTDTKNYKNLIFLGDIHNEFNQIEIYLKKHKLKNTLIFQVGDFGIGFYPSDHNSLTNLNGFLKKTNNFVYAIRGNHDEPTWFSSGLQYFSNINFVKDYTILTIKIKNEIKNIFCLGGAISIDRKMRVKGETYWEDEIIDIKEEDKSSEFLDQIKDINIIVTHTAPLFMPPFTFGTIVYDYAASDNNLIHDLDVERNKLSDVMEYLFESNKKSLTHYFYGHFHVHNKSEYKGVRCYILNINDFFEFNL